MNTSNRTAIQKYVGICYCIIPIDAFLQKNMEERRLKNIRGLSMTNIVVKKMCRTIISNFNSSKY